jgi:hypothetical protein
MISMIELSEFWFLICQRWKHLFVFCCKTFIFIITQHDKFRNYIIFLFMQNFSKRERYQKKSEAMDINPILIKKWYMQTKAHFQLVGKQMFINMIYNVWLKIGNEGNRYLSFHSEKFISSGCYNDGDNGSERNVIIASNENINDLHILDWYRAQRLKGKHDIRNDIHAHCCDVRLS